MRQVPAFRFVYCQTNASVLPPEEPRFLCCYFSPGHKAAGGHAWGGEGGELTGAGVAMSAEQGGGRLMNCKQTGPLRAGWGFNALE